MAPHPEPSPDCPLDEPWLDPRTRGLVRLAALFVLDAPTASVYWAVDLACAAGVGDEEIVAALLSAASAETAARLEAGGEPLAAALGYREQATGPVARAKSPGLGDARRQDRPRVSQDG